MSNTEELVGKILNDRYAVLEKIGTGGMAIVYKAHDKVLDRDVAIKVLRESYDSESAVVSNFIKEARSSASLVHPNVVSVYDVCEFNGFNYMVMELVNGKTLKEYIKKHPRLPWQEACDYAIQIGQGIQAAHERNIIHRDIKPQNIIMDASGVLKVTDFGIAKAMESDKAIAGGTAMGSVHYISPEQARGGYTDFRSDIYSLGVVLYEMLAGRVPFNGDSPVSVALMHIEEEPVNVKCINMDVPADLAYVTMKAMSREQSKRYQKMQDFLDDLRAVLAGENLPSKELETGASGMDFENEFNTDDSSSENIETRVRKKSKEKVKKKSTERRAVSLALATAASLVLIIAFVAIIIINPFSKTVPDFSNLSISDAKTLAQRNGYTTECTYSYSDNVPENMIISQSPDPGTEWPKDKSIKLVVSLGATGGAIQVPQYVNTDVDDAIADIVSLELSYNIIYESDSTIKEGKIIRQTPPAGTHLNPGDEVNLYVCSGATIGDENTEKVKVPSLVGMSRADAESLINKAKLKVGAVLEEESNDIDPGLVIRQEPEAGKVVSGSAVISMVISKRANTPTTTGEPADIGGDTTPTQKPSTPGKSKRYSVKIPDECGEMVHVKIVANGNVMHDSTHSKSEGVIVQEITGTGNVRVQTYIDGVLVQDETLKF